MWDAQQDHLESRERLEVFCIATGASHFLCAALLRMTSTTFDPPLKTHRELIASSFCSNWPRRSVTLEWNLATLPAVIVERNRVLQILVSLINNAKYALQSRHSTDPKRLVLRSYEVDDDRVAVDVDVEDNGCGISGEALSQVLNRGFTTKAHGQGRGLHSGAINAEAMGGRLEVKSPGEGQGSTRKQLHVFPGRSPVTYPRPVSVFPPIVFDQKVC